MTLTTPKLTSSDRDNVYVRAAFNYVDAINEAVALPTLQTERLRDCMSKDSLVDLGPSSMVPLAKSSNIVTADDQIQFLGQMTALVKESNVKIHDWVLAPGPRVILQAKAQGHSHTGQPYVNDHVFFIHFVNVEFASSDELTDLTKQGGFQERAGLPKATFTREFVDSAFLKGFIEEEGKRAAAAADK